jgi:hypothetical protein
MNSRTFGFKGFKFNPDSGKLFCQPRRSKRPTHYEEGKVTKIKGDIAPCYNGIHFCKTMKMVLEFYRLRADHFFAEVSTGGEFERSVGWGCTEKIVAKSIRVERILPTSEVLKLTGYKCLSGIKFLQNLENTKKKMVFESTDVYTDYIDNLRHQQVMSADVKYYEDDYCLVLKVY